MTKRKSTAKHFTAEQIARLSTNPNIKCVTENRLQLTFEFRTRLYDEWISGKGSMQSLLRDGGIDPHIVGDKFVQSLKLTFRRNGKPTNGGHGSTQEFCQRKNTAPEIEELLATGLFVKGKAGRGITFSEDFRKELYSNYPDMSIEDQLEQHSLDPAVVGYQRIYALERQFNELHGWDSRRSDTYSPGTISLLKDHPYVASITPKLLALSDSFYAQAYAIRDQHITKILSAFEIDPTLLSVSVMNNICFRINHWEKECAEAPVTGDPAQLLRIQKNINVLLEEKVNELSSQMPQNIARYPMRIRKAVCELIRDAYDHGNGLYHLKDLLSAFHVSEDLYYKALSDHYLDHEIQREKDDERHIRQIKAALDSSPYPLGSRMLYMKFMHSKKTKMGREKILRLMRKAGIQTTVRKKASPAELAARKELLTHVKPNLLSRRFRLAGPLTILLTDVTYLICGEKTFYLSVVKDAVTGCILCSAVSEYNDLSLAMDTLSELKRRNYSFHAGAIFHSDQGVLYLSETFQNEVAAMGFTQSMSRRGCCWDNASQESFFGHFKDEVSYEDCASVEQIRAFINDYIHYYNYERPQWTRCKMAPVQYQRYMEQMNDRDFRQYLEKASSVYKQMRERSLQNAVEQSKKYGKRIEGVIPSLPERDGMRINV